MEDVRAQVILISGLMIAAGILAISAMLNIAVYTMNIVGINSLDFSLDEYSDLILLLKSELRSAFRNASHSALSSSQNQAEVFNNTLKWYLANLSHSISRIYAAKNRILEIEFEEYNHSTGLITKISPPWASNGLGRSLNVTWCGDIDLANCPLHPYSLGCWLKELGYEFFAADNCLEMEYVLGNRSHEYYYEYTDLVIIENHTRLELSSVPAENITRFLNSSRDNMLIFLGNWDREFLNETMYNYCDAILYDLPEMTCWNVSSNYTQNPDADLTEICLEYQASNRSYVDQIQSIPLREDLIQSGDEIRYPSELNIFFIPTGSGTDLPQNSFRYQILLNISVHRALALSWGCWENGSIYSLGLLQGDVYRDGSLILESDLRLIYDLFGDLELRLNLTTSKLNLRMKIMGA